MDKKLFVVTLALAGIVLLYSVLQQARSYEDCVLKNMPQPKGELTATYSVQLAVERLCRDKFPSETKRSEKTRALTASELGKITGNAGLEYVTYGDFRGTLYNENATITIRKVEIQVMTVTNSAATSRPYLSAVSIPPKSTSNFSFPILHGDADAKLPWSIVSAEGIEVKE